MSSVLRVGGVELNVEDIFSIQKVVPETVWRKDEFRSKTSKRYRDSGVNYLVSDEDLDDFKLQVADAYKFLKENVDWIRDVVLVKGVEYTVLDFAVSFYQDSFAVFCAFPSELVKLAAIAGVGLEVSFYPCSRDDECETNT
jgi:hypothetical protein